MRRASIATLLLALLLVALPNSPLKNAAFGWLGAGGSSECRAPATAIRELGTNGSAQAPRGTTLTLQGVVTGDFQTGDGDEFGTNLGGYFIQEVSGSPNGDGRGTRGLYVHDSHFNVSTGDLIRVTGTLGEHAGQPQLLNVTRAVVCASGRSLPEPAMIRFPLNSRDELRDYLGALVTFPQELIIVEHHNFDRYGEVTLALPSAEGGRPYASTHLHPPGDPRAAAAEEAYALSTVVLDDGRGDQNPDVVRHPSGERFTLERSFRAGDAVVDLTGVLDHRFGSYRVQPLPLGALPSANRVVVKNPRPKGPPEVGGTVRVASFNVENYFATQKSQGRVCGPTGRLECRGAADAREFSRQRAKVLAALEGLNAHVVGLMEVENDAVEAALIDLVEGLNERAGKEMYARVSTGPLGTDAIRVALIYQPDVVRPAGVHAVLDTPQFVRPLGGGVGRNRPALAQTFEELSTGERFTVVVNHLKSKGSPCGEPGEGGPEANCAQTRTLAAGELMAWLSSHPTGKPGAGYLLIGDLNAYARERPITALLNGPDGKRGSSDDFVNLTRELLGTRAYTYLFDGRLGSLDHAIASPELARRVTGVGVWHINADEPDLLDYSLTYKRGAQRELYEPNEFRSSDHDPILVGLDLTRP